MTFRLTVLVYKQIYWFKTENTVVYLTHLIANRLVGNLSWGSANKQQDLNTLSPPQHKEYLSYQKLRKNKR